MKFFSYTEKKRIIGFAFLQTVLSGRALISDSVTLCLQPGSHSVSGWYGQNIGLPVMHATSLHAALHIPESLRGKDGTPAMLVQLLTAFALSLATNRTLVKDSPAEAETRTNEAYNELFPEFADTILSSVPSGESGRNITLAPDLVDFGVNSGLVAGTGTGLRPADQVITIEMGMDCCALDANIQFMKTIERLDLSHLWPEKDLDLAVAEQALRSTATVKPSTVWFYSNAADPAHAYRLQAAASYPLLAELLAETPTMRAAIDSGSPLGPVIAEETGLTMAKLKRLGRIELATDEVPEPNFERMTPTVMQHSDLRSLLNLCCRVDSGWVPNSTESWIPLQGLYTCLSEPLAIQYGQDAIDLLMPARGQWLSYTAKLADEVEVEHEHFDARAMQIVADDLASFVDDFLYSVLLPQLLHFRIQGGDRLPYPTTGMLIAAGQAAFNMFSGVGQDRIRILMRHARRWQNRMQSLYAIQQQNSQAPDMDEKKRIRTCKNWPALADDFTTSAGYVVRCLNTVASLKEESRRLHHCVGKLYVTPARYGTTHLFSIQNAGGDRSFSTFEVRRPLSIEFEKAIRDISVVQHKASSNRKPGPKLRAALAEWMSGMTSGAIDLNLQDVVEWFEKARSVRPVPDQSDSSRISPREAWDRILKTRWQDSDVSPTICNEWYRHILPRQFTTPDQLRTEKHILELGL